MLLFSHSFRAYAEESEQLKPAPEIEEETVGKSIEVKESTQDSEETESTDDAITEEKIPSQSQNESQLTDPFTYTESETQLRDEANGAENKSDSPTTDDSDLELEDKQYSKDVELLEAPINKEVNNVEVQQQSEVQPRQGLADIKLLNNSALTASKTPLSNGRQRITLTYTGSGVLNLSLLSSTYIIFNLPPELRAVLPQAELSATYDVPALGILVPILRNRGSFDRDEILISGNQVYMNFRTLLSLNLLTSSNYIFTLNLTLPNLPPTPSGQYVFRAESTSELVDLSLISGNAATATLAAPQLPAPPVLNEPIYTTDTVVTGKGLANSSIVLRIGGNEYRGQVNAQGDFSVAIPQQPSGTTIVGRIINSQGYESGEVSVVVQEPPDMTPPAAPIINSVYSNNTVVTGSGEANADVIASINGVEYSGIVGADGTYSVTIPQQNPGTVITVRLVDEAGNVGEIAETTVIEATVAFYNVPENLLFENQPIESKRIRAARQEPDWSIEVIDTRGPNSTFRLLAEVKTPLTTNDGSHSIPGALVYVDALGTSYSLENGPVEVYSGQTQEEPITSISWEPDEGPLVDVNTSEVYAGSYNTTITWTLVDGP